MASNEQYNPNLVHLIRSFKKGRRGAVLEGSSRSGKTWSGIDFLVWYCSGHKGKIINIIRETYNSFKTTLYNDFNERLPQAGIESPFANVQEVPTFRLLGNKINLLGTDKVGKIMGAGCDVLWLNEAIHVPKSFFDQFEMRCKEFFYMDYNPEESDHWIYDSVIPRDDVAYLKTTFLDNPHCPPMQRRKILSYDPGNPENVKQGTADPYMWDVYGRGIKAERKGRIYPNLYRYTELPEGARHVGYGGDFGYNAPTALVDCWVHGNNIYLREVMHAVEAEYVHIYHALANYGCTRNDDVVFDSEDPRGINTLKGMGIRAWKAEKKPGSVMSTIKILKTLKIHIHTSSHKVYKDFENYTWEWDDQLDKPIDKPKNEYKHSPDAAGYIVNFGVRRRAINIM